MIEGVKGQCSHCGHKNQFDARINGNSFFCTNCGKKCVCDETLNADKERIKIDLSDLESVTLSSTSNEKLVVDFSPHIKSSFEHSTATATSSRPSFSDLRNQVTVVLPEKQTTVVGDMPAIDINANSQYSSFELPFMAGDFLATDILAKGGMSITYLGHRNNKPSEKVVIKIPDLKSSKTVTMFANECKILAELAHPNIVPIIDFGEIDADGNSFPYMVMKYIDGQSLRQKLKVQGKFSWDEASLVLNNIASALDYLYQNNFCHRDIKPDNIIFDTQSEQWILVDFGIAKSLQDNLMLTMTMAGQDSGTWDYMPPEQLEGRAVDIRCDIYALGTVIWEILIGTVPRRGTKLPAAFGIELPADVDILIGKMVEHNLDDRYQTPADILAALRSGAQRIETWKKTKSTVKNAVKISSISLGIILLLAVIWFVGEFIAIAKAKEIYEKNRSSATVSLCELSNFSGRMPFFWGKRYVSSVIPDLKEKAGIEEKEMKEEFARIENSIKIHSGSDNELETRQIACENFIAKWGIAFPTSKETLVAKQNNNDLRKILLVRKEKKLLKETLEKIKKSTASKKQDDYRSAFEECRQLERSLSLPETKKELSDFVKVLRSEAVGNALVEVEKLIASSSKEDWISAYEKINTIRDTLGDDPELSRKQDLIDDKFWEYYRSEAEKALNAKRFASARANVATYLQTGMTRHKNDATKYQNLINDAEERHHWDETQKNANQYMNDKAFIPALEALNRFAQKYPNTQLVNLSAQRKIIADNFLGYIIQQRTDLDSYQENMDVFLQRFPEEKESIQKLRRFLCWSVHNAIGEIVFDNSLAVQAKTARLSQIKYNHCEEYQKKYLNILMKQALNYASKDTISTLYGFQYFYQRPPEDCIKMKSSPTIYNVTITEINVSLSESHYQALKGWNNCNPQIRIGKDGYSAWRHVNAPVNTYSFTLNEPYSFWWNIKDCKFKIQICDADDSPFDAGTYWGTIGPEAFKESNSTSWKWDSGTTLEMKWTTK